MSLQLGAQTARASLGKSHYNEVHKAASYGWAAANGFAPINPLLMPLQVTMMIVFTLVLIFAFKLTWWKGVVGGYIIQGLVVTIAFGWITDHLFRMIGV